MNVKMFLEDFCAEKGIDSANLQFPDCDVNPGDVDVIMINEVPLQNPDDYFYSKADAPDYMKTTIPLFRDAGVDVHSMADILSFGIYITTAVKSPKSGYAVETEIIKGHLPILAAELDLFPGKKVIMLMGDVAKKSVNMLHKAEHKKNLIPSEATYKIRGQVFCWGGVRVFPSYIMTGGNILIEKGKRDTITDDIKRMMKLLNPRPTVSGDAL